MASSCMNSSAFAPSPLSEPPLASGFVDAFDGRYYRIAHCDRLPPFFMNVVSASDLWLFVASNGGITAGRVNPEGALFPYRTVDLIYDAPASTGPFTFIRAPTPAGESCWEPFAAHTPRHHAISRHLYKSVEGDRLWFEEINHDLGLAFRYGWATAEPFGFIRRCELENLRAAPQSLRLVDGLRNLLPAGVDRQLQNDSSCLVDAYKTAELLGDTTLAIYALSAGITDRATPLESLRASIVWSHGLPDATVLLAETQLDAFHRDASAPLQREARRRGLRGTYALAAQRELAPGERLSWLLVADTGLSQADILQRAQQLAQPEAQAEIAAALAASTHALRTLVASADGLQAGAAETTTAHHFANTLFNLLRGGVFAPGAAIDVADFTAFVRTRHAALVDFAAELPAALDWPELRDRLAASNHPDLLRLGYEYLPLTFSRRHGDPSRPWNRFNIHVRTPDGGRRLHYEGNWRDIFQNWEALCLSFPAALESVIAKFLNASTVDGYNPYRVSRDGIDWEVPEPDLPWASIGYWGDHQAIYLLKLLEWSDRFHPGFLAGWLRRPLFSYADVPYRLAPYDAIRADPRVTIEFDAAKHRRIVARAATFGTDARLRADAAGRIIHVNLTEKLLVLLLVRLTNFIPGGGIWMNTQRPEWNDANNALVGYGVSVVTLGYLRRFLAHVRDRLLPALGNDPVEISSALVDLARAVARTLDEYRPLLATAEIPRDARRRVVDALGAAGSEYRAAVYREGALPRAQIAPAQVRRLVDTALEFVDHTIRGNRRDDGLYHSYNLLRFVDAPASALELLRLQPMLEGQVAVLSSGLLSPEEAVALLRALRASSLYRADQHSYLLQPDRALPDFLDRARIPEALVERSAALRALLASGDTRLVQRDPHGAARFHPDLVNHTALQNRLETLATGERLADFVRDHAAALHEIYERVFHHHAYTGRSGSMFGYEGLGCIYWHMVAKLLVAVQENLARAHAQCDPAAAELTAWYYEIRGGLGFNKTPERYGAFPTDPYSHTPGHAGAQQPGMTGQVKEEILTRFGELGVTVTEGCLQFEPTHLLAEEFTREPTSFRVIDEDGHEHAIALPIDALGFTVGATPVIYRLTTADPRLQLVFADGGVRTIAGSRLDRALSAEIFRRSGRVRRIDVELGREFRLLTRPCAPP